MSSRLRSFSGGSKLARPVGTGLKAPGKQVRPSPQPTGGYDREGPPMTRTTPVGGQRRPPGQVRQPPSQSQAPPPRQKAEGAPNGGTPALKVGDNVLVGGVKPGIVAFLGTTQFAPGVWAGIVLDSYDGKNNGTVRGVSYFQCEPNRGLFSKPDKLTLVPQQTSRTQPKAAPPPSQGQRAPPPPSSSFEVGDRIIVDGEKPGTVGFIGETQFARGVWAGIILDTPDGKNNGQVAGISYFECAPNHGLFTRPQKLTLVEKVGSATPTPTLPSPSPHQIQTAQRIPQDTRSTSSQESAQSATRHLQPTPSDLKALRDRLKIGDHVLVNGAKEGRLRYLGPTEFAKGIWAGVELPEPMGKNDGAVSGKRYFQCDPKHGLFAPLPKIEKLACAADSVSTMSATSLRSSTSPTPPPLTNMPSPPRLVRGALGAKPPSESSTSSYGVQDQRVSSLQGSTAAGLSRLLQQREDSISSLKSNLELADTEKKKHEEEVTELRRQVDDLQFQLLEQGVISGDVLEKTEETSEQQVTSLTRQLQEEREKVKQMEEQLEVQQGSSGDSDGLRSQLVEAQTKLGERAKQITNHLGTITKLQSELSLSKEESKKKINDLSQQVKQDLSILNDKSLDLQQQLKVSEERCEFLSEQKSDMEAQMSQLSELSGDSSQQLSYLQDQLKDKDCQINDLHVQNATQSAVVSRVKGDLQLHQEEHTSKVQELEGELREQKQRNIDLEREIEMTNSSAADIQEELRKTQTDLQDAMDLCSQHEALVEERNHELNTLEAQVRTLSKDQELWVSEKSRLQIEQERITSERDRAISECDRLMEQTASTSSEQSEMSRQRRELLSERDQLLSQQQALQTENEKLIGERDEVVHQLSEIQAQRQEALELSQQMNVKFDSTNIELTGALSEIEELRLELARSKEAWEHEKLAMREEIELAGATGSDMRQRIDHASAERDSALQQAQELADRLDQTELERDQLQLSLEAAQGEVDELNYQMEELRVRHDTLEQESSADSIAVQHRLEMTESLLAEREGELAEARERVSTLSEDLIASQGKYDQALLEEEKQLLEERVKELTIQLEKTQEKRNSASFATVDNVGELDNETLSTRLEESQSQLLEAQVQHEKQQQDITDLEQQIDFLNSVIADLQRKLETAEALSGLHGPLDKENEYADDEDDMVEGLPPPRLFCDICDEFDQHDTDDCPLQAASDSPPPTMHHGARAPGGSDRPYCDNCEVFGHFTDDCEYEATY